MQIKKLLSVFLAASILATNGIAAAAETVSSAILEKVEQDQVCTFGADFDYNKSVFIITSAEEFATFGNYVNTGVYNFKDKTVVVQLDEMYLPEINMTGTIGNSTYDFKGNFDGNGVLINNSAAVFYNAWGDIRNFAYSGGSYAVEMAVAGTATGIVLRGNAALAMINDGTVDQCYSDYGNIAEINAGTITHSIAANNSITTSNMGTISYSYAKTYVNAGTYTNCFASEPLSDPISGVSSKPSSMFKVAAVTKAAISSDNTTLVSTWDSRYKDTHKPVHIIEFDSSRIQSFVPEGVEAPRVSYVDVIDDIVDDYELETESNMARYFVREGAVIDYQPELTLDDKINFTAKFAPIGSTEEQVRSYVFNTNSDVKLIGYLLQNPTIEDSIVGPTMPDDYVSEFPEGITGLGYNIYGVEVVVTDEESKTAEIWLPSTYMPTTRAVDQIQLPLTKNGEDADLFDTIYLTDGAESQIHTASGIYTLTVRYLGVLSYTDGVITDEDDLIAVDSLSREPELTATNGAEYTVSTNGQSVTVSSPNKAYSRTYVIRVNSEKPPVRVGDTPLLTGSSTTRLVYVHPSDMPEFLNVYDEDDNVIYIIDKIPTNWFIEINGCFVGVNEYGINETSSLLNLGKLTVDNVEKTIHVPGPKSLRDEISWLYNGSCEIEWDEDNDGFTLKAADEYNSVHYTVTWEEEAELSVPAKVDDSVIGESGDVYLPMLNDETYAKGKVYAEDGTEISDVTTKDGDVHTVYGKEIKIHRFGLETFTTSYGATGVIDHDARTVTIPKSPTEEYTYNATYNSNSSGILWNQDKTTCSVYAADSVTKMDYTIITSDEEQGAIESITVLGVTLKKGLDGVWRGYVPKLSLTETADWKVDISGFGSIDVQAGTLIDLTKEFTFKLIGTDGTELDTANCRVEADPSVESITILGTKVTQHTDGTWWVRLPTSVKPTNGKTSNWSAVWYGATLSPAIGTELDLNSSMLTFTAFSSTKQVSETMGVHIEWIEDVHFPLQITDFEILGTKGRVGEDTITVWIPLEKRTSSTNTSVRPTIIKHNADSVTPGVNSAIYIPTANTAYKLTKKYSDGETGTKEYVLTANWLGIESFKVTGTDKREYAAVIDQSKGTITLDIPANALPDTLSPDMVVYGNCSNPNIPSTTTDYTYTVTSPDGFSKKEYKLTINATITRPVISSFSILGHVAQIDDTRGTITVSIPASEKPNGLVAPDWIDWTGVSISPDEYRQIDLTSDTVRYTVKGTGSATKTYRLIVNWQNKANEKLSIDKYIILDTEAKIDNSAKTISVWVPLSKRTTEKGDQTARPTVLNYTGTTISPSKYTSIYIPTNDTTYTIESSDGLTKETYTLSVNWLGVSDYSILGTDGKTYKAEIDQQLRIITLKLPDNIVPANFTPILTEFGVADNKPVTNGTSRYDLVVKSPDGAFSVTYLVNIEYINTKLSIDEFSLLNYVGVIENDTIRVSIPRSKQPNGPVSPTLFRYTGHHVQPLATDKIDLTQTNRYTVYNSDETLSKTYTLLITWIDNDPNNNGGQTPPDGGDDSGNNQGGDVAPPPDNRDPDDDNNGDGNDDNPSGGDGGDGGSGSGSGNGSGSMGGSGSGSGNAGTSPGITGGNNSGNNSGSGSGNSGNNSGNSGNNSGSSSSGNNTGSGSSGNNSGTGSGNAGTTPGVTGGNNSNSGSGSGTTSGNNSGSSGAGTSGNDNPNTGDPLYPSAGLGLAAAMAAIAIASSKKKRD